MTDHNAGFNPALVDSIAGLTAGAASTIVVHPLDVIKTRLQLHRSNADTALTTSVRLFRSLVSQERPLQTLYRGLTPNLLGNASSWALFFYFKTRFETQLRQLRAHSTPIGRTNPAVSLTSFDYFVASGLSGLAVAVSTNPIWVIKTRMLASDRNTQGAYENTWAGVRAIWKSEGLHGFYRGLGVNCFGVLHGAIQFAAYETMKEQWRKHKVKALVNESSPETIGIDNGGTLVVSALAKVFAGTVMYPQQVIRSRLQTYEADKQFGRTIREAIWRAYCEEGWRGFYRGLGPNILRVLPSTWVTFLVYENVRVMLPRSAI